MKKEIIGQIGVDSGSILISDPSYINDCFSIQGEDIYKIYPEKKRHLQINTKATNNTMKIPIAVTLRTGYGDGVYPVTASYNEDGVISKIEINFE
jgi:hypothetical protein